MDPEDIPKTAICTPFGLFEFTRMTFGLCNAAQTFQRFIHSILRDIPFCFAYLDDVLVASKSEAEHLDHLKFIFQRFAEHGLIINVEKCNFLKSEVKFLGHLINAFGIKPSTEKVEAIKNYELPKTVKDLRRFLGMVNFYRRFIPNAAEQQASLNDYLKGSKKDGKRKIDWTPITIAAFENIKSQLMSTTLLNYPNLSSELGLFVDASNIAIGAALQQKVEGNWQPLGFYSTKLNSAQTKYSAYDRELLAAYKAIKYFRHHLEGTNFILFTDHKPLIFAFKQNPEKASPRQMRHLDFISQFTTNIKHISGKDNVVADALSRLEEIRMPPAIDFEAIAVAQNSDTTLKKLLEDDNYKFSKLPIFGTNKFIYAESSNSLHRPYIPEPFRHNIFNLIHNLSHPGIRATNKMVTSKYFWPGMNKDVNNWSRACLSCQKNKISRHVYNPFGKFPLDSQRFRVIHIDIIGPLPPSEGYRYCLTAIDRFTRWPEAIPLKDISAQSCAEALFTNWFARFGIPEVIITDQGGQFESLLFKELCTLCGCKRHRTTPYHPQANGLIERWHRTLKTAITAYASNSWSSILPSVLLGLRTSFKEDLVGTPAELLYGESIRLPSDFVQNSSNNFIQSEFIVNLKKLFNNIGPSSSSVHGKAKFFKFKDLDTCDHVFLRTDSLKTPFQPPYEGPYKVISRENNVFTILVKDKKIKVSSNRLKPCFTEVSDNNISSQKERILVPTPSQPVSDSHIRGEDKCRPASSSSSQTDSTQVAKRVKFRL